MHSMRFALIALAAVACMACGAQAWTMKAPASSPTTTPRRTKNVAQTRKEALLQGSMGALVLGFAAGGVVGNGNARQRRANAFPFGGGDDAAGGLDEVARAREKVEEVLAGLKSKQLKGGKEDSSTVIRYLDAHYKPLQEKMVALAPKLKLDDKEKQERAETLPLLLKGHLLELVAAARKGDAAEQLEEMEEVAESVDEFLALGALKYQVKSYLGPKPEFDVMKEYGPFSCEFYGKVRLPESNVCIWPEEAAEKAAAAAAAAT